MKTLKISSLLLSLLLTFSSCKKDEETEEITEFDGSIKAIEEFYSPELVNALEELGFNLNEGSTPPNIEGVYLFSPFELIATTVEDDEIGDIFPDYTATITNQNNEKLTINFSGEDGSQIDKGVGSFISGSGKNFCLFLKITSKIDNSSSELAIAVSGKISAEGIENTQFAGIMLDDKGDIEEVYIENNTGRLFKDQDNFSERITNTSKSSKTSISNKSVLRSNE